MRFLLDVNAGGSISEWLKERGHDVVEVRDYDSKMEDEKVLAWAFEEERIIITTDKDFEAIIWKERRSHKGVIRLENLPRKERLELMTDIFDKYSHELQEGRIIVATRNKIRIRK